MLPSPSPSELATHPLPHTASQPSTLSAVNSIVPQNHSYIPFPLPTEPDPITLTLTPTLSLTRNPSRSEEWKEEADSKLAAKEEDDE